MKIVENSQDLLDSHVVMLLSNQSKAISCISSTLFKHQDLFFVHISALSPAVYAHGPKTLHPTLFSNSQACITGHSYML